MGNQVLSGYNGALFDNGLKPPGQKKATQPVDQAYVDAVKPSIINAAFLLNNCYESPYNKEYNRIGLTNVGGPVDGYPFQGAAEKTVARRMLSFGGADPNSYWGWTTNNNVFNLSNAQIDELATNIVNYANDNGYNGVNVDIETTSSDNNDKIVSLIKSLRQKLDKLQGDFKLSYAAAHIGACNDQSKNAACNPILKAYGPNGDIDANDQWLGNAIEVITQAKEDIDWIDAMSYTMVPFTDPRYESLAMNSALSYVDLLTSLEVDNASQKVNIGIPTAEIMPGTPGLNSTRIDPDMATQLAKQAVGANLKGVFLWSLNWDSMYKLGGGHTETYLGEIMNEVFDKTAHIPRSSYLMENKLTSNKSDRSNINGTSGSDFIMAEKQKQTLRGLEGDDTFVFKKKNNFGKNRDKIIDFSDGDKIAIGKNILNSHTKKTNYHDYISLVNSQSELNASKKTNAPIVYFQEKERIYLNGNGSDKGWGENGGLMAILSGSPEITSDNIEILG